MGIVRLLLCSLLYFLTQHLYPAVSDSENSSDSDHPGSKGSALIFGGNGQIGSHVVEALLRIGFQVHTVHLDEDCWHVPESPRPSVPVFRCDRNRPIKECDKLVEFTEQVNHLDLIVDLTATSRDHVVDVYNLVGSKTKLYLLLSSQDVYQVCLHLKIQHGVQDTFETRLEEIKRPAKKYVPWVERDCLLSMNATDSAILAAAFPYAYGKFMAEEALKELHSTEDASYIVFRAASVISPRESVLMPPLVPAQTGKDTEEEAVGDSPAAMRKFAQEYLQNARILPAVQRSQRLTTWCMCVVIECALRRPIYVPAHYEHYAIQMLPSQMLDSLLDMFLMIHSLPNARKLSVVYNLGT